MQKSESQLEIFAKNLAYLRKCHDISKKEMASILKIGIRSLNKIESGIIPPQLGINVIFYAAKYFSIHISDLLSKSLPDILD